MAQQVVGGEVRTFTFLAGVRHVGPARRPGTIHDRADETRYDRNQRRGRLGATSRFAAVGTAATAAATLLAWNVAAYLIQLQRADGRRRLRVHIAVARSAARRDAAGHRDCG